MTRPQRITLLATIIGSGVVILDSTVVNLALPNIAQSLHASFADLQWIADGYLLSLSALILLGGSLGDIFGRKKIYLLGLIGFAASSLCCGLAPNTLTLTSMRVLQGISGALLVPGALAIISTNFPKAERGAAIGSWSAFSAIFATLGPLVGGYILSIASWRWIFLINVPLIAICYILAVIGVKEGKDGATRRVDLTGALLAMGALAGVTYGLIQGPAHHWQVTAVAPLTIGIILCYAFIVYEKRVRDPMVNLQLFASANFRGANLMTFGMYGALSGFFFALVLYLQLSIHYSPLKAGLSLLPTTIIMVVFSKRVGAAAARRGARDFLTIGPILSAAGILLLLRLTPTSSNYLTIVLPGVLLFSIGLALVVAPLTSLVVSSVADSQSGIASGINNAVSRVAGLLIVALLGLLGTSHVYRFALFLSALLALAAGLASFVTIKDTPQSIDIIS